MTYSTGGVIQAVDYNGFVSTGAQNVNATLTSYGQTTLSTVSAAATVTATQWATLNTSITSLAAHQGTTITSRTNPQAGNIISVLSNLSTDVTALNTNLYNAASSGTQFTGWTGSASKTTDTGSGTNPWTITFTDTVTFANATAASSFFNAGGLVKIQFGKSSTGTSADTQWNTFVGTGSGAKVAGAIYVSSTAASKTINGSTYTGTTKTGGSGTPAVLATGVGFAQLNGTPQTIYQQFDDTTTYTGNYIQVQASISGAVITLTTTWFDDGGASGGSTDQITGGTASSGITFGTAPSTIVTYINPESTNITNSWGSPTVASSVA